MKVERSGVITVVAILALFGVMGGLAYQAQKNRPPRRPHSHAATDRDFGGHTHVVALGNDEYHAEVVLAADGKLYLFTLGADETRVQTVAAEPLPALIKGAGDPAVVEITLTSSPQTGDPPRTTSRFTAVVPATVTTRPVELTVPILTVEGSRFRFTAAVGPADHATEIPAKVTDDEEQQLYLTPGGTYTVADIAANGRRTASDKFKRFRAKHDPHPKSGDRLCPVTSTQAHPDCVGGRREDLPVLLPAVRGRVREADEGEAVGDPPARKLPPEVTPTSTVRSLSSAVSESHRITDNV